MMSGGERLVGKRDILLERVNEAARMIGTHKVAAERTGIPYATLQRVLKGTSPLTHERITAIAEAAGIDPAVIYGGGSLRATAEGHTPYRASDDMGGVVMVPALNLRASAGDGSLAIGERLGPGPFHFSSEWLRAKFGSIANLRLVQITGASQEPDLHDGDWALIDQSRTAVENGLAVLVLDDCLMIKRIQREGRMLRLVSRNDQYPPIELDLQRDEDRLRVIGRAVFVLKAA